MRLWSIHPSYLDSKGLVALWRETLLAQNVLLGQTKGYKNHPQLNRFKNLEDPINAISCYLHYIADEADSREYNFNRNKIVRNGNCHQIEVTEGQIAYEFKHLLIKLKDRDPSRYDKLKNQKKIEIHPLFARIEGNIEEWEIIY